MIANLYKQAGTLREMKEVLEQQGILLLPEFLDEKFYNSLMKSVKSQKGEKKYSPAKFSFSELSNRSLGFFNSNEFKSFIRIVVGKNSGAFDLETRRFGHKNFTLLHDDFKQVGELDLCFFILENEWDSSWGGNLVYSGKETRIITPQPNSFAIIRKKRDMQPFVKYVNHFAGKGHFVIVKISV